MKQRSPLFEAVTRRYRAKTGQMLGQDDRGSSDEAGELAPEGDTQLAGAESDQDPAFDSMGDAVYYDDTIPDEEKARLLKQMGDPRAADFEELVDDESDDDMMMGE